MKKRLRGRAVVGLIALGGPLLLAACGSSTPAAKAPAIQPGHLNRILAAPKAAVAFGTPQPNGNEWVLAGNKGVRAINLVSLSTGKVVRAVGVSNSATGLAQSSIGTLAVGLGTATTGAVQLLNGTTGRLEATVPVGDPVKALAFGLDGVTAYALNGNAKSASVTVINTSTDKVVQSFGVPLDSESIVPNPDQTAIWTTQASGAVQETLISDDKPITAFDVGGFGVGIAESLDSKYLYVLKNVSEATAESNISVINTATEKVVHVLPGALSSVAITLSLDGSQLYDLVGAPNVGNIQILSLSGER